MGFCLRRSDKSGIILIIVLWMLAILSVLAVGLGRAARMDLSLLRHRAGKIRSDFLVWAAGHYAMNQLRLDGLEAQASQVDTVYQCGFALKEGYTSEQIFRGVSLESGTFDIGYTMDEGSAGARMCYGFQDEDSKLALNAINSQNARLLVHVFMLAGLEEIRAEQLTAYLVDWKDADSQRMSESWGAEKNDYAGESEKFCKNAPFEYIEELLLVKDIDRETFDKVKNVVTVFPQTETLLQMNVNTASTLILRALFRFVAERNPSVSSSDADSLTQKIVTYRLGEDGLLCTADDRPLRRATAQGDLGLNVNELAVFAAAQPYLKETSSFLRLHARGTDSRFHIATTLQAVLDRDRAALLRWKRQ